MTRERTEFERVLASAKRSRASFLHGDEARLAREREAHRQRERERQIAAKAELRKRLHVGDPVSEFFNERNVALCAGFMELARQNDMRGSTLLKAKETSQVPTDTGDGTMQDDGAGYSIRAYLLGILRRSAGRHWYDPANGAFLCEDDLIRGENALPIEDVTKSIIVCGFENVWFPVVHELNVNGDGDPGGGGYSSGGYYSLTPVGIGIPLKERLVGLAIKNNFQS